MVEKLEKGRADDPVEAVVKHTDSSKKENKCRNDGEAPGKNQYASRKEMIA